MRNSTLVIVITSALVLLVTGTAQIATSQSAEPVGVSISLSEAPAFWGWFKNPVTATAITVDNGCGIRSVRYSLDGAAEQDYPAGGIVVSSEGSHYLTVTATNNYGDSATASAEIKIDRSMPIITVTANGQPPRSSGWYNGPVTFLISGTDTVSGIVGMGIGTACTVRPYWYPSPWTWEVSASSPGSYSINYYYFSDRAQNMATSPSPIYFGIDTEPPTADLEVSGIKGPDDWYTTSVTLTITASDTGGSGLDRVTYTLNGGPAQEYTGPVTVSADGNYHMVYTMIDRAGSEATGTRDFKVDTTAPVCTPALTGSVAAPGWYRSPVSVDLSTATDTEAGIDRIEYTVDGTPGTYAGHPLQVTSEGLHTITYTVYDGAGNALADQVTFGIDTTAPTISASVSGTRNADGLYTSDATLTLVPADSSSGIQSVEYSLDNVTWKVYTDVLILYRDDDLAVYYRGADLTGNQASGVTIVRFEPLRPPTISMAELGYGNRTSAPAPASVATPSPASTVPTPGPEESASPQATPTAGISPIASASPTDEKTQTSNNPLGPYMLIGLLATGAIVGLGYLLWRK